MGIFLEPDPWSQKILMASQGACDGPSSMSISWAKREGSNPENLGKFHHDLTVLPNPGIMVYVRGIIPFYGPTIQVSETL